MIHRYLKYDPARHGREERFRMLFDVFRMLLVRTAGDAEEALSVLGRFGERQGWFDDAYSIDDFREDLVRKGILSEGPRRALGRPEGRRPARLTSLGERLLRQGALERAFAALAAGTPGDHRTNRPGGLGDETEETRTFQYGDSVDQVAWTPTFRNALLRRGGAGGGWSVSEEDLEIREREFSTGCATVLLVDVSHSMILYGEDRMSPAREIALALDELIRTRYRRDTLDLVLFGDDAEHVPLDRIPYIEAGPYHTNTKAGLKLAREILSRRRHANRRIFMITDGKPSALWSEGRLLKNPFGLDERIVNRTLDESHACRKAGIEVTTFMVAEDPLLVEFVDEFTKLCRGRAFYTGAEGLGRALFVDYVRNRRTFL